MQKIGSLYNYQHNPFVVSLSNHERATSVIALREPQDERKSLLSQ